MKTTTLLVGLAVLAFVSTEVAGAEDEPIEIQIVDAMNKLWGMHPGFRANHAKGIVVEGSFKASPEAAALSRAVLFDGSTIPVTVRFSDATGIPNLPDGSGPANPHGMAIKYHLPDGSDTDMVINSLKFFPVSTGADFRDLLLALAASPPDAPKPTKFDAFAASHPAVPAASATATTPDSFADEEYHGINAFVLVNKADERQAVRYRMVPSAWSIWMRPKRRNGPRIPDGRAAGAAAARAGDVPPQGAAGRARRSHGRRDQALARGPQGG